MRDLFIFAVVIVLAAVPAAAQVTPVIDTHVHIDGRIGRQGSDWPAAVRRALERMDEVGVQLSIVTPPPQPPGHPVRWECDDYVPVLRNPARRFVFICGGGTINPLVHQAASRPALDGQTAKRLDELVSGYATLGAVGIGEITAQHFSFETRHPYLGMAPDHPAMLHLADAAARHRLPIGFHMEAVSGDFDMPEGLRRIGPANPARVPDNMAAFERLLAHNRDATVIWLHFGWDNTGQRSGEMMNVLFQRHPNLVADLKIQLGSPPARGITAPGGGLRPEFIAAIEANPDRYMIGSDAFYMLQQAPAAREMDRLTGAIKTLLGSLTPETARKVSHDNAVRVFRLKERGLVP